MNKSILKSKTFWVQVITFLAALFPPVQAFVAANPIAVATVLTSVNVALRIVTSGKITIFADGTDADANPSGGAQAMGLAILTGITTAGLLGISLPSCSPQAITAFQSIPIHAGLSGSYGSAKYSSKSGLDVEGVIPSKPAVDTASGK